jgi:putative DNA primase/helicase
VSDHASLSASEPRSHPDSPLAWARSYAARGWPVFPVHTVEDDRCSCGRAGCSSAGKHPRTRSGLKDASSDPNQVTAWWASWPDANIGLVTGAASGLLVLDVDVDHDGDKTLRMLEAEHAPLSLTVTAQTGGGGNHYLFAHPGGVVRNSAGRLGRALDLRGDGGYIVAPPSNHHSGGTYRWLLPPEEVDLARPPEWLLERIRRKHHVSTPVHESADSGVIGEGQRNARLASVAGSLRQQDLGEEALRTALLAINSRHVVPPLSEAEVAAIAASISRYPVNPKRYRRSDYGNAERLVDRHGTDLRYVSGIGWHAWDGERWRVDRDGGAMRRMKATIRSAYSDLAQIDDDDERRRLRTF